MDKQILFLLTSLFWSHVFSQSCLTPLGVTSRCVSLFDCPSLLAVAQQSPLPQQGIDFLRQSHCGSPGVPTVCCGPYSPQTNNVSPTFRPNTNVGTIDPVNREDSSPAPRNTCGIETNGDRIFGGEATDLDEFPWMALMGYRIASNRMTYQCGGALINRRYVLTAAHCIIGAIETKIGKLTSARLGEYDTRNAIDCVQDVCADPYQEIPVHIAVPHSGYSDSNKNGKDDIGLVRLARRVTYNYYVQPICLANPNERLAVQTEVHVAGWGKALNNKNSPVKLKLKLPIFDHNECIRKYQTVGATLSNKQLCAGGAFEKDACTGDSGGPLMRLRPEGVWDIVAVVSLGYGCGRDGWPGVYTSVDSYLDWIHTTMRATNV